MFDLHEAARSRASSGKARGERAGRKAKPWFAADRLLQPASSLANRFARAHDAVHVQPRDSVDADLDRRREVIERGGDQLSQLRRSFRLRWKKGRQRAKVLSLARCHPGQHTRMQRLLGNSDDVLFPISDHDGTSVQVGSPGKLEVSGQTTADAHFSSSVRRGTSTMCTEWSNRDRAPRG